MPAPGRPEPGGGVAGAASRRRCALPRPRSMEAANGALPEGAAGGSRGGAAAPSGKKEVKVVIVGDGGCGKTSLLMVYAKGAFPEVSGLCRRRAGAARGAEAAARWGRR